MSDNVERLLKFRVENSSVLNQIMEELLQLEISESTALSTKILDNTYFDTENRDLQNAGFVYWISREGENWIANVKHSNPSKQLNYLQERQDWNIKIEEPTPDINYFEDTPIGEFLKEAINNRELYPIFKTCFERKKMNLLYEGDSWIEISGDIGEITANVLIEPISEIKLELKIGSMVEMLKLGSNLVKRHSLFMENRSKHSRGLVLAGLSKEKKEKKSNLDIKPKEKITWVTVKIIIFNIYEIINAQENLLAQMEDPECVHQLRVKLRQLRALLSFTKPLFNLSDYHEKQEQLRKIGLEFSLIREYDVLLEEIEKMVKSSLVPIGDFPLLKNELGKNRKEELKRRTPFLKSNQLTFILLDLWVWLLENPWTDTKLLDLSIKKYSEQQLELWAIRMNKAMKKVNMVNIEDTHKVRIRSKKSRYVMEQLTPILDNNSQKSINKLERLQEDLGNFHDVYRNKLLLEKLIEESDSNKLHYEAGIIIGWQINQGNIRISKYM